MLKKSFTTCFTVRLISTNIYCNLLTVQCYIWLEYQFHSLVFKTALCSDRSPLYECLIKHMFCQCKAVAIVTCSLWELRQCEQHCVCALRFREFKMVILLHLFEEEGIESHDSPLSYRVDSLLMATQKTRTQNRTSSQCRFGDFFSCDRFVDPTEDTYVVVVLLLFWIAATKSSL